MKSPLLPAAAVAVSLAVAGASAGTSALRVRVTPASVTAGQPVTIAARTVPGGSVCGATVTRLGAPATKLATRRSVRGGVSWRWLLPASAQGGTGVARVTCRHGGSGSGRFTIKPLPPPDPVAGKQIFLANCGGCHILRDAGTQGYVGPNLDQTAPTYDRVVNRVTNGAGAMPSFKNRLTTKDIRDVAAYVSSVAGSSDTR